MTVAHLALNQHDAASSPPRSGTGDRGRKEFAALYRAHYATINSYIQRRVGDPNVADDLTSEVFLAALRWRRSFRDRGYGPRPWLYRIASNIVARWWQTQHKTRTQTLDANLGASAPAVHDTDLADAMRRAIAQLSLKSQVAISLYHLEELSIKEVAAALGCRTGAVKTRLSRARTALRVELRKEGVHDE